MWYKYFRRVFYSSIISFLEPTNMTLVLQYFLSANLFDQILSLLIISVFIIGLVSAFLVYVFIGNKTLFHILSASLLINYTLTNTHKLPVLPKRTTLLKMSIMSLLLSWFNLHMSLIMFLFVSIIYLGVYLTIRNSFDRNSCREHLSM